MSDTTSPGPVTDLVLEGGGVKGVALAGALQPFGDAGYSFARIGGTSAGAIVGAVLAALQQRGEPVSRLEDVSRTLDFSKFPDRGFPGRHLGPLGFLGDGLSVLLEDGAYEGDYLRRWLGGVLGDLGVETFGDLRTDDPGDDGSIHARYRLTVTATDLSRRRLVYLPWQYDEYARDPDEQPVVDAVRASASIPYFFEPVTLSGPRGTSTLVDGALVSNYPISMFDRDDGRPARWPTIGIRLSAPSPETGDVHRVRGPVPLGISLVQTAIEACQAEHVLQPCNVARSVAVDTSGVSPIDFDISDEQRAALEQAGSTAAQKFLATWDYDEWLRRCRPGPPAARGSAG
ncbi:MAG TPA: patatin-like phospholipase family protein [Nocardioidaceae bacterium]|jgi:NTE family protein|nr:patatin-like phospholipase family protein [Nocardioidaceae bacterium]